MHSSGAIYAVARYAILFTTLSNMFDAWEPKNIVISIIGPSTKARKFETHWIWVSINGQGHVLKVLCGLRLPIEGMVT